MFAYSVVAAVTDRRRRSEIDATMWVHLEGYTQEAYLALCNFNRTASLKPVAEAEFDAEDSVLVAHSQH